MKTIEDKVITILKERFASRCDPNDLSVRFKNDLGLDSLDTAELIMVVEIEFDICITDDEADEIHTVDQLINCIKNKLSLTNA
ncbi:acyl carrier protein [Dyadobacter subterraneus]|uniref:Acyl carrier protein n=1 Tax=Dyadobacter subterraneus TaxID=2773304 RepID=A0ABR9WC64_9BACT|nr:acyl carrier protein [Dyadobacter subterraneus]MBE9461961.1 acyl carrier protein [Dyadobacter subterraneus]